MNARQIIESTRTVPGGFRATRDDGRIWEYKLDPQSNCYRLAVSADNGATWARNMGSVMFSNTAQAAKRLAAQRANYTIKGIAIEDFPDEPWEFHRPIGGLPDGLR